MASAHLFRCLNRGGLNCPREVSGGVSGIAAVIIVRVGEFGAPAVSDMKNVVVFRNASPCPLTRSQPRAIKEAGADTPQDLTVLVALLLGIRELEL